MIKGQLRWWRTIDGKVERAIALTAPGPDWMRGMGPYSQETREKASKRISAALKDKPKSLEHRQRMREAKLGVPKSAEHVAAKSAAAQHRVQLVRQVMAERNIGWYEAMTLVPRKNK